jgi:hypothetical protein
LNPKYSSQSKWVAVIVLAVATVLVSLDVASNSFFYTVQGDMCRKAIQGLSPVPTAEERAALLDCSNRSAGIYHAIIAEGVVAGVLAVFAARLILRRPSRR